MAIWQPILACIIPNIGGWLGSIAVSKNFDTFYAKLNKPSWNPPSWLFGPVWTILYVSMGYASYLVWRDGGGFRGNAAPALVLYIIQLLLNWAWTPIFFGFHLIKWGFVEIVILWIAAACCAIAFGRINLAAGALLAPYMAWLTFASVLNYYYLVLNPEPIPDNSTDIKYN